MLERFVAITAPARLHMGFVDLGGSLGRKFGSIGVAFDEIGTRLRLRRSENFHTSGPGAERAVRVARRVMDALDLPGGVGIEIDALIPEHVGLGSGTQLGLAVGVGIARLWRLPLTARDLAPIVERGARSGIGIAVFDEGGFVLDGGRGPGTEAPPVLARLPVPERWRLILVFDRRGEGLHGQFEVDAFKALPPFPDAAAARLCHILLMQGLPALAEANLSRFGGAIEEIQRVVGDHFAPVQGGRFTSPRVREALEWLKRAGAEGIGQSSWGPTGFCLAETPERAECLVAEARCAFASCETLEFLLATPRGRGADVRVEEAAPASEIAGFRLGED